MIHSYNKKGNVPSGIHPARWDEIQERYGYNEKRLKQLLGLKAALDNLKAAGCKRAYLDGSFITQKELPRDFDLCWEPEGVDATVIDPLFIVTRFVLPPRSEQKAKYCGEILITLNHPAVFDMLNYFQLDDRTGDAKAIISIDLNEIP
jgi:hypothetical protein